MIEKFNVPALQQWRLQPLEINCLHPRGWIPGWALLSLQRELPAPRSPAHVYQPSGAPLALASASDEGKVRAHSPNSDHSKYSLSLSQSNVPLSYARAALHLHWPFW